MTNARASSGVKTSNIESSCEPEGEPIPVVYDVCFISNSDKYGTKSTDHQSKKLKNMIRAHGWYMTSLADMIIGQSLESAIGEMVARSVHVIAFIGETDCGWTDRWVILPLRILERNCHTLGAHRVIPVISCELEIYTKPFPNLAQFSTAHIEDANFEENLIKSIETGMAAFRKKDAMLSEGIYFMKIIKIKFHSHKIVDIMPVLIAGYLK